MLNRLNVLWASLAMTALVSGGQNVEHPLDPLNFQEYPRLASLLFVAILWTVLETLQNGRPNPRGRVERPSLLRWSTSSSSLSSANTCVNKDLSGLEVIDDRQAGDSSGR